MKMLQVSVFVENKPGSLKELLMSVADSGISIRALSIADTADFGIVRMILSDTDGGIKAIRNGGFVASTTEVIRAELPDVPGGLVRNVITPLSDNGINIEYSYAFLDQMPDKAVVVLKVDDVDAADRVLKEI
jgi:hypothetical protein